MVRPLGWLVAAALAGTLPFLPRFGLAKWASALSLSVANTLGVLGFRKDFVDQHVIEELPRLLKVVSGCQTILGAALLFLFGLALRNRFRMK